MDREHLEELRELVEFLKANEIAEFDMERPDLKVRLKFAGARGTASSEEVRLPGAIALPPSASTPGPAPVPIAPSASSATVEASAATQELLHEVKSPIVGTFYESSAPGAAPFVKVGDQIEVGQVLCIVEAMKLMNEIESDVSGEIVQRIAVTGQPVEYGQALFAVRPR